LRFANRDTRRSAGAPPIDLSVPTGLPATLDCRGKPVSLDRPQVMGILNVTPDSFYDGGLHSSVDDALRRACAMEQEGAAIIDVGGESTRPGANPVPEEEELSRVLPALEALQGCVSVPVSVDTSKPAVMRAAVRAGAGMVNDVRALGQPGALEAVAELGVPVCLMHMQGEPRTMQRAPAYRNVVGEIKDFLASRIEACLRIGIPLEHIVVDPGFGFGKTPAHNLLLLRHLDVLQCLGVPILVGLSRKSMVGTVLGDPAEQRLYGSLALAVLAVWQGAILVRAHDISSTVRAVRMCAAVRDAEEGEGK
jgi:dihydropteroate synthase